jgi:hypothetical protein
MILSGDQSGVVTTDSDHHLFECWIISSYEEMDI